MLRDQKRDERVMKACFEQSEAMGMEYTGLIRRIIKDNTKDKTRYFVHEDIRFLVFFFYSGKILHKSRILSLLATRQAIT